jgi:hypothetical protein
MIGLGFSFDASAQTSGIIPLDAFNHHGEISIENVQVSEKEFYKVIHLNIQIKVKDLGLEDSAWFEPDSIKLVNENGKSYLPTREECTATEPPGTLFSYPGPCFKVENECGKPMNPFGIKGTEGGIGNYHPCFRVEKEFNNFKVYYGYDKPFKPILDEYNPIGNIILNEKNEPTSDVVSNIKNINITNTQDFFAQFFEWIKNLFKFS